MKRLSLLLLMAWSLNHNMRAQTEPYVCKDARHLHALEQMLDFRSSPFTADYDLVYQRAEWEIDPAQYYIKGQVMAYFAPTQSGFATVNFDLSDLLQVHSVLYRGQTPLAFSHADDRLEILLPAEIPAGQLDSVAIRYEGAPASTGFGSFTTATVGGSPVLWTLSQPYGAKDWWPTKQDLSDKIDSIDIIVRTPAPYRAASNGLLVSEREDGAHKIYHWRHRYPIPAYLVAIAVADYAVYSDFVPVPGGEPIEVLNYAYPGSLSNWQSASGATVEIMQLFNELFGLYPFAEEKYGHAQFAWGGGMEHQTMSFMGGMSHLLQAHELAHQWFGNKITCGSWSDIWLNEGFATYLEGMTYEFGLGPNTWRNWLQVKINQVTSQPDGAVFVADTTSVSRIFNGRLSYSKGALLLHMLRWKLGDAAFFQGVRNYLDDPALAYGYARTPDLQRHLEQASGQVLDGFFADWFYGEGHPSYQVNWQQQGSTVWVEIEQATSHPSVDFFALPVPIQFVGSGGFDTIVVFDHAFSGQLFAFEAPEAIAWANFDPELWLCSRDNHVTQAPVSSLPAALGAKIKLFPNPAGAQWQLRLPAELLPARAFLYDAGGKLWWERVLRDELTVLPAQGLAAGAYFLRLQTSRGDAVLSAAKH
jgi:aminopeptidase N